jgi:hypothetical protein
MGLYIMQKPGIYAQIMYRVARKGSVPLVVLVFFGLLMFLPLFLIYDYTIGDWE